MSGPFLVHIHYIRPPDRTDVFTQWLVQDRPDVKVTFAPGMSFDAPLVINGVAAAERGSDLVWFTFPGCWHDIGRFYRADGTFTGFYANVLTPPRFEAADRWRTTDLFLDVWLPPAGNMSVLDEDEMAEARARGWVDVETAARAAEEIGRIREAWRSRSWPPPVTLEWTRRRARETLRRAGLDPDRPAASYL